VDLSVVILNWNTCALLDASLRSLTPDSQTGIEFEIIVVDNNSEDGSADMVRGRFPNVHLIANTENTGFGAGNNTAIPQSQGRYILFLNSDTVVTEGALTALVRYVDANPDVGIVGAKLLNADGSLQYSCRRYPNLGAGFFRNTPLGRLFPKNRFASDYLMKEFDHASPRDVDWVSGAALMMRRTLIDRIGAFDEDFYMYCEDVDLCWRTNHTPYVDEASGGQSQTENSVGDTNSRDQPVSKYWRVSYFPDAVIYHYIGKSSDLVPTRMTYEFHRSQYLFYKKHYAATMPILMRPLIPVGIALRAVGKLALYRTLYWRKRLRGELKQPLPKPPESSANN